MTQQPTGIAGAMDYVPAAVRDPHRCFTCGGEFKNGCSYSARAQPGVGVVQFCSETCHVSFIQATNAGISALNRKGN